MPTKIYTIIGFNAFAVLGVAIAFLAFCVLRVFVVKNKDRESL